MTAPITTKNWTIDANKRNAYVSLVGMVGWFAYEHLTSLLAAGWVVKWTSDGTNGPASAGDNTNLFTGAADFATRATIAAAAQAYFVVENTANVELMITYQGASDDIARISFSPTGFTLAGTPTHQPTASDEMVVMTGTSVVNATTSADRVMTIWTTDDTMHWSFALFRQSTLINVVGVEFVNSLCGSGVFAVPYVGYRFTNCSRQQNAAIGRPTAGPDSTAFGSASWLGIAARVFTAAASRVTRVGAGELIVNTNAGNVNSADSLFNSTTPALQGASSPAIPIIWSGERAANLDGLLGYPVDWWQMVTSVITTPALGDFVPGYEVGDTPGVSPASPRSNWFVSLGSAMIRPWKNAAATLEII